ncbi:hypothetical protein FQR65_LT15839 [Abscondita terminalis]|nr:hypothetical protein FQR65_LT15839 [Abscondita terminalis]
MKTFETISLSFKYESAQKGFWEAGIAPRLFLLKSRLLSCSDERRLNKNKDKSFIAGGIKKVILKDQLQEQIIGWGMISLILLYDQEGHLEDYKENWLNFRLSDGAGLNEDWSLGKGYYLQLTRDKSRDFRLDMMVNLGFLRENGH